VSYAILVIAPRGQPSTSLGYPSDAGHPPKSAVLRCILVNGAQLKSKTYCAACAERIGESYVRQIGTRKTFCDLDCYQGCGDRQNLTSRAWAC
jgi:hypothetical protein